MNSNKETSSASRSDQGHEVWEVRRRSRILAGLNLASQRIVEFGPLSSPLVRKSEGEVTYVDHLDRQGLVAKYAGDPGVKPDAIPSIDVVIDDRPLHKHFAGDCAYTVAIASHVAEHVPDLVGWLQEVASLLEPGGLLLLTIPDKRYTFDCFRRSTSLADLMDAFLQRSRKPTPGQVFDQVAHEAHDQTLAAWVAPLQPPPLPAPDRLTHALHRARAATAGEYVDVHCWVFTPESLLRLLSTLAGLGLLPFRCVTFVPTQPFELEMTLRLQSIDTLDRLQRAEARESFEMYLAELHPGPAAVPCSVHTERRSPLDRLRHILFSRRESRPAFAAGVGPLKTDAHPLPLELIGRTFPRYRPVLTTTGDFVDQEHRALADLPCEGGLLQAGVPGFLRQADALLLYELAWHAAGDVLEIGSAWGLSTTVLCRAVRNAGRGVRVASVEIDPDFQAATARAVLDQGLQSAIDPQPGPADQVLPSLKARRRTFSVVFIDHDHSATATRQVIAHLAALLRPGGIAVFHDFNDERNVVEPDAYGVYPAVLDMLREAGWRYLGVQGCCALVQRTAR